MRINLSDSFNSIQFRICLFCPVFFFGLIPFHFVLTFFTSIIQRAQKKKGARVAFNYCHSGQITIYTLVMRNFCNCNFIRALSSLNECLDGEFVFAKLKEVAKTHTQTHLYDLAQTEQTQNVGDRLRFGPK